MIDDDVIFDLLPLYRAGAASEASRELVQSWLASNPEFDGPCGELGPPRANLEADQQRALNRARKLSRWRRRAYGFAMALTAIFFAVALSVDHGRISGAHLVALQLPRIFAPIGIAAAVCWIAFWRMGKNL